MIMLLNTLDVGSLNSFVLKIDDESFEKFNDDSYGTESTLTAVDSIRNDIKLIKI